MSAPSLDELLAPWVRSVRNQELSLTERIRAGSDLWRARGTLDAALEVLKEDLRALARNHLGDAGTGVYQVTGGGWVEARVTFQPPELRWAKGRVDVREAQAVLTPEEFDRLFSVGVKANASTEGLSESALRYWNANTIRKPLPGRVTFKDLFGVEPPR